MDRTLRDKKTSVTSKIFPALFSKERGIPDRLELTLINRDAFHNIRVRNYETMATMMSVAGNL